MRDDCGLCASTELEVFLRAAGVPVHQHLLLDTQSAAVEIRRGDLEMTVCHRCGFVFNNAFDVALLDYGDTYENYQGCSPAFAQYVAQLINDLVAGHGIGDSHVVEVGSGNGAFLRALVQAGGETTTGQGFDPAYRGPPTALDGRVRFVQRFYGPDCADARADVVVSRHVIEHVPEPVEMLRTIRVALAKSPRARVYFETPDVRWILRNSVMWDFFYEHCSLFSPGALGTAFRLAGFQVDERRPLFDGQYQWLSGRVGEAAAVFEPEDIPELAKRFGADDERRATRWGEVLSGYADQGTVALWGAGAKAVTFAGIVDPNRELVDCVVDLNPRKQDCFLPGTGHPIVAPDALVQRDVATVVLLNPNYYDEVSETLIGLSPHAALVSMMGTA